MAGREDTPLDQGVFDKALEAELAKGTDRRVAEGRARSAGVRAYRAAHPEETQATAAPAAAGNGGGDGQAAAPAAARPAAAAAPAAAAPVAAAAAVAAPVRTAPPPTGKPPAAKPGAPDKHRLLALVPPEGIQRVEREQGDRINVWPHLMLEEFVAMLVVLALL